MEELQNKLLIIYSIILFVSLSFNLICAFFIMSEIKLKEAKLKEILRILLIYLIILPLLWFASWWIIRMSYYIAKEMAPDDFGSIQILSNVATFYGLWSNFQVFTKKKNNK